MQQHLMQMQPMMAAYDANNVTTDIIQQYLDENKQLILHILDCQNLGKLGECAENQARLQRNLMYLAAIADSQPQPAPFHAQFPPVAAMQPGARHLQQQQAQQMTPQSLMASRSSMLYAQQSLTALQQATLQSQLGLIPGGNSGLHMLHGDAGVGGNGAFAARGFPDFGRSTGESLHAATSRGVTGTSKQDIVNAGSMEGRGPSAGGENTDVTEPLYLKSSEEVN